MREFIGFYGEGGRRSRERPVDWLATDVIDGQKLRTRRFIRIRPFTVSRKYFLISDDGAGGIYEYATRAEAEAWFNHEWEDWMESPFAVRPILTIFDNIIVLDNEVAEVCVDGTPVSAPWKKTEW
ncbi:MAG: hypothetical protein AVO34_06175 [Firmicutes bacterium ML8_F2]|nr:MAG: hypothetical protein AVO34_06175 [Firmicutes bacterium ML8_F2]